MNTTNPTSETTVTQRKGLKPYQLSIALGIGIAAFTMISGIIPHLVHWHNDSPIHREVFEGIPGYLQIAFYTIIPALLVSVRFNSQTVFATGNVAHLIAARPRRRTSNSV